MKPQDRFKDNPTGIISDEEVQKGWLPKDSYGDIGKWVNWNEAQMYLRTMAQVYAGGCSDWRMPTKEEALQLYQPDLFCLDFEGESIHIHPIFVPKGGYYLWTSEVNDADQALRINLRDGTTEFVDKSEREFHVVRGVRSL